MSYAEPSNTKAVKSIVKMTAHWESAQSVPYGCKTMQLFTQGEEEIDDDDMSTIVPHDPCDSGSTTSMDFDEFGEDPWDDSEFATYRCNSVRVSHIPSEPVRNPHDYDEDLNDIVIDSDGNIVGTYIHRVTLVDENVYQPTSIDANIVDLKLSKLAFEGNRGNMFHFNIQGHFDAGS